MANECKRLFAGGVAMMMTVLVVNIAFWGGLIWFVFWLLRHYGVI